MAIDAGTRLGPYEILSLLGAGGMGEVYQARDTRLGRDVAVKVLPATLTDSTQARARFRREAQIVAALQHPHICTVHDVGDTSDGQAFLVLELLQGETLHARLARGALDAAQVIEHGIALADALDAAHAAGIVHRDIKPANIFLTTRGPKILDFGVAKAVARADAVTATGLAAPMLTQPGGIVGTTTYMSPEQLRGEEIDSRSDLFSLGLVLYEMATGRPAFDGTTSPVIAAAILNHPAAPPSSIRAGLPSRFDDIIAKTLEKDRALRYQHATELRADLQRLKRDESSAAIHTPIVGATARHGSRRWWVLAGAAAIAAMVAGLYFYPRQPAPLTATETVVIADFINTTGDPVFDDTLRQGLSVQLQQSPFLSIATAARVQYTLGLMGRPPDAPLTRDVAREVCERTGGGAVIEGSIASLGTQYVLGLRATRCEHGEVMGEEQVQAATKEEVLPALGDMSSALRTRLGESLSTLQQHNKPLREATTASLEALKAYSTGLQTRFDDGCTSAIPLYTRAVEIDDQFATAHAHLGLCQNGIGETEAGVKSATRAFELRDRATDPEKFYITAIYHRQVTGNLQEAYQTFESWTRTYPREALGHGLWSGFTTQGTGNYDKTIEEANRAIELSPDMTPSYANVANANLYRHRLDEAERALQRAVDGGFDNPESTRIRYRIAFLKDDAAAMERELTHAKKDASTEVLLTHSHSLAMARAGRLQLARQLSKQAADRAQAAGQRERAAVFHSAVAVWEGFFGHAAAARTMAQRALELSSGRDVSYAGAVAFALAGDLPRVRTIIDDLDRRFPEDTSVRFQYLPTLRGLVALSAGQPVEAISQLEAAAATELHMTAINYISGFGGLYPVYVRGQAYLANRQYAQAAAEFEKVLAHRGVVLSDPVDAFARLGLARARAAAGDVARAREAYKDLLTLWKDADANVAVIEQARREAAKLQ